MTSIKYKDSQTPLIYYKNVQTVAFGDYQAAVKLIEAMDHNTVSKDLAKTCTPSNLDDPSTNSIILTIDLHIFPHLPCLFCYSGK